MQCGRRATRKSRPWQAAIGSTVTVAQLRLGRGPARAATASERHWQGNRCTVRAGPLVYLHMWMQPAMWHLGRCFTWYIHYDYASPVRHRRSVIRMVTVSVSRARPGAGCDRRRASQQYRWNI